ncbi:MAG: diguanylate cyclase [Anaerolineales bacterium]|jgi:diguanylate cyclase (GGDEF)-like protein/PAS domain S-box-containing protein
MVENKEIKGLPRLIRVQLTALEAAANGVIITDPNGIIIWVNPSVSELTGYNMEELLGNKTSILRSGKHSLAFYEDMWETITSGKVWRGDVINRRKDGTLYNEDMTITPVLDDDRDIVSYIAIKQDITAYRQAIEELEQSNERFLRLVNSVHAHFYMVEYSSENGYNNKYFSNNIEQLTGYPREEFIEDWDYWSSIVHPDDRQTYLHNQRKILDGQSIEAEYRILSASGEEIWVNDNAQAIRQLDGRVMIYATISDITERKQTENRIRFLATHDPLTNLPNRIMFREILEHAIQFAKRNDQKFAVFFLDIDNFKQVNDTFGHHIGDELLTAVASRLKNNLREHDTVSRISGDEFTLITEQLNDESHVEIVAKKINSILQGSYQLSGTDIEVNVSIGGSVFPLHGSEYETLLRKADAAMYQAKNSETRSYKIYAE